MIRLSDETKAECIRLRVEKKLSTPAIAKVVGLCNASVYSILRDYPWAPAHDRDNRHVTRGKRWTEADVATLRTVYPGETRDEIMRRLPGRTWEQIGKMASMSRILRRPLACNPPKRNIHPLLQQLRRAREFQRLTRADLANRIGHSENSILLWECSRAWPHLSCAIDWALGLGLEISLQPTRETDGTPR